MKYDDVNYTLEKHLKNMCDENYQYMDLFATWEIDKKVYKSMLQGVSYNFIHYSMHDSSHSKSIISKIEMILGPDRIKLLGATETWMILECAYSHDCGMILKNKDIEKIWESDIFQDFLKDIANGTDKDLKEAAEYILKFKKLINEDKITKNWPVKTRRFTVEIIAAYFRGKHPEKSKEYINDFNNVWGVDLTHSGLIESRLIRLVGDIAFLHGQDFEGVMDLEYIADGLKTDYIYPRFIAEMIRLGDLLDLDNGRFNDTLIENFGELPELSKYHLGKHGAIIHMLVTPEKIDVSADCKIDGEVRETRKWFDWLRDEVNNLTINWRSIVAEDFTGTAPQIGKLSILKNGKKTDARTENLKLGIPRKRAFEILEGSGIYKSKLDFLRELIQNALDASKIQMWRDLKNGTYDSWIKRKVQLKDLTPFDIKPEVYNNYKIIVKVEYIENKKVRITVKDKGIGINQESLFNMANVGESWDKRDKFKKELEDMPSWLKPTGGFGIGIQSCFMATNEINIKTKTSDNDSVMNIKIESGKEEGYITSEIDKDVNFNRGSEVIVDVPENIQTKFNFGGYVFRKLQNYDSFTDSDEFCLWSIIEYIQEEFQNSLFEIELIHKDEIQKNYNSFIENNNMRYQEDRESTDDYLFIFDNKDLNKTYLWDKQYSAFILVDLLTSNNYNRCSNTICFKGVMVESSYVFWIGVFRIYCDINGMDARRTLTLSRKNIRQEAENDIFNMLNKAVKFVVEKYKQKIKDYDHFLIDNDINTLALKFLSDIYKVNEDEINNTLIDNSNEKIYVLQKNDSDDVYNDVIVCAKEILKCNEIALIDIEEIKFTNNQMFEKSMFNHKKLGYDCIIVAPNLLEVINQHYYLKYIDGVINNNSKVAYIYKYDLTKEKKPHTIEIADEVRKSFLKNLISKYYKRKASIVLKGYEKLAVQRLPKEFSRQWYQNKINGNSYPILSPITREDYNKIKNGEAIDLIKDKIKGRKDFTNLVNYVFENKADDNKASKEDIINDYMKLIDEYYDLVEKDNKKLK